MSTDSQHGAIWQAIIRIWWDKIMEQFGYKIAPKTFKRELKHTYTNLYTHVKYVVFVF